MSYVMFSLKIGFVLSRTKLRAVILNSIPYRQLQADSAWMRQAKDKAFEIY